MLLERLEHGDVEGIRVGRFPFALTTTCIVYRLRDTALDTGPPNQWRVVRRFLRERGLRQALVTHHHEDHSGNLAAIRGAFGAEILAPARGIDRIREGFPLRPYQRLVWGRPDRIEAQPVPGTLPLGAGWSLVAIHCPGHSADMTCYLEPNRGWLFSGDLYISGRTRYLRQDEDLTAHLESLRRILDHDFDTLFCSHRGLVAEGKTALQKKLAFLESLCQEVAVRRRQGLGIGEITHRLLGREDLMTLLTGYHFSKRNLIRACWDIAVRSET